MKHMELQHQSSEQPNPSMEKGRSRPRLLTKSTGSSYSKKKGKKHHFSAIRRSERIQNAVLPYKNQDIEPVVEEISASDSDKEEDPPASSQKHLHEPACENTLIGKIDYLVHLLKTQEATINELKTKDVGNPLPSESLSPVDVRYRSLYIESQKKIQALMDENRQLALKLEAALGKVEAYDKGTRDCCGLLDKVKDLILISNMAKVTETAVHASSQAIRDAMTLDTVRGAQPSAAKRKKITKAQKS